MPSQVDEKPDVAAVLSQLKDFQRATVDYVFRRMYTDGDPARRFLVADEVGLGKTLVARGVIVRAVDHLWEFGRPINVVYVCSNADIARQNIRRLNVTGGEGFTLASRITLLPVEVRRLQGRLNFLSFTPKTSLALLGHSGWSRERELLYHLLEKVWALSFNKATRLLAGSAGTEAFRARVKAFEASTIQGDIANKFAEDLGRCAGLQQRFEALAQEMPRAGAAVPAALHRDRSRLIGELRRLLARTCIGWLKPDLIILDEFQRFKNLLGEPDDSNEADDARELAQHLFNYQSCHAEPSTAARVLLLSATPYKMYTLAREADQDDHYQDFSRTLGFLLPDECRRERLHALLKGYREELFRLAEPGRDNLAGARTALEDSLRRVMVRTERLALSADRNGMLAEAIPPRMKLAEFDVENYLALQGIARALGHEDVLEYWKSVPYLLNFMDDYDLKRKLTAAISQSPQPPELIDAVRACPAGWLRREDVEGYRKVEPGNARLRCLHEDTVGRGAWRLLWIPPSLPYYRGEGPFADPQLAGFTKRLVFTCWRVVPKAVSALLSYDAERHMVRSYRKKAVNTAEARQKRRPLLRFTFRQGRPTGMPALALVYPCRTLARRFDPLTTAADSGTGERLTLAELVARVEGLLGELLQPLVALASSDGPADESWYWAAPLLLDLANDREAVVGWFAQDNLAQAWAGNAGPAVEAAGGWARHVEEVRRLVRGELGPEDLGPPPADLARTVALLAVAGPGTVTLRALGRIALGPRRAPADLRDGAGPLAHAFLHLFNLPEVIALVRDRKKMLPYWRSVLDYCAAGNLQAVVDEYAHVLVESLGLLEQPPERVAAEVSAAMQHVLTLRTSTVQADVVAADARRIRLEDPIRLRTRFAMRFGDQDAEEGAELTRADHVRAAFNSPFWPFVLTTTSVGQEGLDFHTYCHAVVHWNLPANPVDLEQREGRVHRYKGHALRKNIAAAYRNAAPPHAIDPWWALFVAASRNRPPGENDLFPFWVCPGDARIERHVPAFPHSREVLRKEGLLRALVLYRMVFGQNRQEDLVSFLATRVPPDELPALLEHWRIDLSPPSREGTH